MKGTPCFDFIILNPTIYLRYIETFRENFEAKDAWRNKVSL